MKTMYYGISAIKENKEGKEQDPEYIRGRWPCEDRGRDYKEKSIFREGDKFK
jgi:hypothetical protein